MFGFNYEVCVMDEYSFEGKINELLKEFGGSSNPKNKKLEELAKKARSNHEKLQEKIDSLQEALDYLRICIKYQLFDLEATKRENKYLKKLLEDKNK